MCVLVYLCMCVDVFKWCVCMNEFVQFVCVCVCVCVCVLCVSVYQLHRQAVS